MAVQKKQEAPGAGEQAKAQETKKTSAAPKPQAKKPQQSGFLGALMTWFLIALLSVILMALFVVIAVLFDFLGVIKVRDFLPQTVLENPYIKDYIRESTIIKSSEESKIKALIYEQESSYKDMADKLKHKEVMVEEQSVKLSQWEKDLRERELEVISKEKELIKNLKNFEEAKKQKIVSEQTMEQFAKMYERMDPQLAADALNGIENPLLLEILSRMKDKRSALIMEKLPSDKVAAITALIKQLAKVEPPDRAENASGQGVPESPETAPGGSETGAANPAAAGETGVQ
jgi:flagellar motility protein MotE (MotC chaperone)